MPTGDTNASPAVREKPASAREKDKVRQGVRVSERGDR